MKALKSLRKALIKNSALVLIIFGVILIGFGVMFVFLKDTPPKDLEKMAYTDLQEEDTAALNTFVLVQGYATETIKGKDYYYYLIAGVDKNEQTYLLSMRVTAEEGDRITALANVSTDYFWFEDQFYHGTLYKISGDLKTFYDEAVTTLNSGYPVTYYVLEATPGIYTPDDTFGLVAGSIFGLMGLAMLAWAILIILGNTQKSVLKSAKELAVDGDALNYLDSFDQSAQSIFGVYLGKDALMFNASQNLATRLIPLDEFVWVYPKEVDQRLYLIIKIRTYYFVTLRTLHKKTFNLLFRKKDQAEAFLSALQAQNPELVYHPYDHQLNKVFNQDPAGFKETVAYIEETLNAKRAAS